MQFNSKIPFTLSILIGILVTAHGTTLTLKDYNNYIASEHKVLGVEVPPLVSFFAWNASFTIRHSEFDSLPSEIINRIIGLIFFGMIVGISTIPTFGAYFLLVTATKIRL
jgi:hypothetical protein